MANEFTFDIFKVESDEAVTDNDLPAGEIAGKDVEIKLKIRGQKIVPCIKRKNGKWKKLKSSSGPSNPSMSNCTFAYYTGSRWVYINGKWYKIG